jgi:hypothetical protein
METRFKKDKKNLINRTFSIEFEIWKDFDKYCDDNSHHKSKLINNLIKAYLKNNLKEDEY